jgi:GntR family transcriptional regulator, transcriptional repressor for pyruvate dehydrogenase complex
LDHKKSPQTSRGTSEGNSADHLAASARQEIRHLTEGGGRVQVDYTHPGLRAPEDDEDFVPLPRRRATVDAIAAIQDQIRTGKLTPGERLPSERALSEALGVSRPTIREAVQSLAAMNILDVRHGAGIFVSSLDIGELLTPMRFALELTAPTVDHLFEIRLALEPLAAELAATRATDEELAGIEDCVTRLNRRGRTREELLELDIELHKRIVDASRNELLVSLIQSTNMLSRQSRELTIEIPGVAKQAREDHRGLADAVIARKPRRARAAMAAHLAHVRDAVEETRRRRAPGRRTRSI